MKIEIFSKKGADKTSTMFSSQTFNEKSLLVHIATTPRWEAEYLNLRFFFSNVFFFFHNLLISNSLFQTQGIISHSDHYTMWDQNPKMQFCTYGLALNGFTQIRRTIEQTGVRSLYKRTPLTNGTNVEEEKEVFLGACYQEEVFFFLELIMTFLLLFLQFH